jgi:hypothetical protein
MFVRNTDQSNEGHPWSGREKTRLLLKTVAANREANRAMDRAMDHAVKCEVKCVVKCAKSADQ